MQNGRQQDLDEGALYPLKRSTCVALVALYPLMHVAAHWVGLSLTSGSQTATLWTSNALLLAVMVILGYRWWLLLLVSTLAAEAFTVIFLLPHLTPAVSLIFSAANMLEALFAALLWQWLVGGRVSIFRLRDCIYLVSVVAVSAPAVSGLLAAAGQVGLGDAAAFFKFWQLWWAANALGILIITSTVLALAGVTARGWRFVISRQYELIVLILLVIGLASLVFGSQPGSASTVLGLPYVLYPLIIWGALRFGSPVSMTLVLLVAVIAITNTDSGNGPYSIASYTVYQRVLSLQMYLAAAAISALLLGAAFSERRAARRILQGSRNKFSKAFHASPDAICICRISDGRLMDANDSIRAVTGYSRAEAVGATLQGLNLTSLEEQRLKYLERGNDDGRLVRVTSRIATKSGVARECQLAFDFAVIEGDLCMVCVLHDITPIRAEEEKRNALEARLMQARKMEAIGQLTGGIAHDFNNILSGILGNVELAESRAANLKDDELIDYLNDVRESGRRARELVAQLLTFGQNRPAHPVRVNIEDAVDEVLRVLGPVLPPGLEIIRSVRPDGVSVNADPVQLQQLIMNLCVNARDATGGNGALEIVVEIVRDFRGRCSSCQEQFAGDYVCLSVSDSGPGIEAESEAKIFEPFYTSKRAGEGTGLGLSVVHGVAHGHNGHIVVDSSRGTTTFSSYFPLAETDDSDAISQTNGRPADANRLELHGTVLLVDDEDSVRKVMAQLLERRGLKVTSAASADDALSEFEADPQCFDLLITDQTMPGMTGVDLAREILAQRPDLPVILCSGFSRDLDQRQLHQTGIRSYVQKPVNFPTLIEKISDLLNE